MPLYEYDCSACGARFDVRGSVATGPEEARCPECRSGDVRRHYGSVAVLAHGRRASGARGGQSPDPAAGGLRVANAERLTRDVAARYAAGTQDTAVREVARRLDAGSGPAELHEFVSEVKAERETGRGKRREQK